jgi:hypothetical protein
VAFLVRRRSRAGKITAPNPLRCPHPVLVQKRGMPSPASRRSHRDHVAADSLKHFTVVCRSADRGPRAALHGWQATMSRPRAVPAAKTAAPANQFVGTELMHHPSYRSRTATLARKRAAPIRNIARVPEFARGSGRLRTEHGTPVPLLIEPPAFGSGLREVDVPRCQGSICFAGTETGSSL